VCCWHPRLFILAVLACASGGCGDRTGDTGPQLGTVAVLNQTDLGTAPLTVEAFFLEPVGTSASGGNRLVDTIPPGGVVIVGLFPPGLYNATAVLEGGLNINWVDEVIQAGEPKNFVIP